MIPRSHGDKQENHVTSEMIKGVEAKPRRGQRPLERIRGRVKYRPHCSPSELQAGRHGTRQTFVSQKQVCLTKTDLCLPKTGLSHKDRPLPHKDWISENTGDKKKGFKPWFVLCPLVSRRHLSIILIQLCHISLLPSELSHNQPGARKQTSSNSLSTASKAGPDLE